jgi:hypothetical protein
METPGRGIPSSDPVTVPLTSLCCAQEKDTMKVEIKNNSRSFFMVYI